MAALTPTAEDVARAALSALNTDAGLLRAINWTSERYRELSARTRLRHLQRFAQIDLPAPVTAGSATVTPGSTLVVGDAVASPTWNTNLIGQFFRAQVAWYEITNVVPSATTAVLNLRTPFAESASGAGTGYRIVQRYVNLANGVRFLGAFVHARRRRKLDTVNRLDLDIRYPGRQNITGGPRVVCDLGVDPDTQRRRVEFYPYNDQEEMITYQYWMIAQDLKADTPLPPEIDLALLKIGVLCDLYRYKMAQLIALGQVEPAALMRNELRAQMTSWEGAIQDLIRADRGTEDVAMILRLHGPNRGLDNPLIKDAHDEVLNNWPL